MRIGDNSFNPYGQTPRLERTQLVNPTSTSESTSQPVQPVIPATSESKVTEVGEGEKQQLLQGYLQQQAVSRDSSAGYQQQKAVQAYSQQVQEGDRDRAQLQEILGVDEYV